MVVLLLTVSLFSMENEFLTSNKAFNVSVVKQDNSIIFTVDLDKTIYLYDEYLKVVIKSPKKIDITKQLNMPTPIEHDEFIVHMGKIVIDIPLNIIRKNIGNAPFELELQYQGCSIKGLCYSPLTLSYKSDSAKNRKNISIVNKQKIDYLPLNSPIKINSISEQTNETDSITNTLKTSSIATILIAFFGFGLLLALTPCIFPMIPILSSIIVQQSNRQGGTMSARQGLFLSIVYVLSMSVAYTIAGIIAGLFGANLQAILQNPIIIIGFSAVFIALAFSMFGYYEIGLPSSWQTKLNQKSEKNSKKGGVIGVAIMGFLSALIVGPCVAPALAGALVYIGQTGDAILGGTALFVMSLGMGLPLLVIGVGAGKYMPKPGDWMSVVSKIFGIVMLAIALWMLDRTIEPILFIYLSSFLLLGTALYLKEFKHIVTKLITTIIFIYGVVLFVGAINGNTNVLEPLNNFKSVTGDISFKKEKLKWEHISTVIQLDEIIKSSKKPIILDFWATWCISCKELDNITFRDQDVIKKLSTYRLIKIDVTYNNKNDKALMQKFNLFGPPALIFYKDGKEELAKRIIGYKNPVDFLKIMK
jgi:thiol:disulfide interchange protein DsbD